jgi:hypothetical protein
VVVTPIAAEEGKCEERSGAEVAKEGTSPGIEVCSGESGAPGEPWTPNNTLPAGAVESGTWSFNAVEADGENIFASISFPIRLETRLEEAEVHFSSQADFSTACEGSALNPKPKAGQLCVYVNATFEPRALSNAAFTEISQPTALEAPGAGVTGAIIRFNYTGGADETAHGFGTWALKAPEL